MDKYTLDLGAINGSIDIKINRKDIKNVHLKVYRDLSVNLNLPHVVPNEWIVTFLEKRSDWIDKQITKYKKARGYNSLLSLASGISTQFLGKDFRVIKKKANYNGVELEEKAINVNLIDINDTVIFERLFQKWWREQAYKVYFDVLEQLYNKIFKKHNIEFPELLIRKMDTLWGSCIRAKNRIVLNEYLLKADRLCIQYVVLHELTHLLYDRHNTDFYSFLTVHMPDWKQRKKRLDQEVVNGL